MHNLEVRSLRFGGVMAQFMDVHSGMKGVTPEELKQAHDQDHAVETGTGVHFVKSWADPESGKVFCLSEGPSKAAVLEVHRKAGHPTDEIYEVQITVE
jgi:hypothetical protein